MATKNKAAKSNVIFGFAITALVIIAIQLLGTLIAGIVAAGAVLVVFAFQLAGLIVFSIFISKYNKLGYDMNTKAWGIVMIVFAFFTWGVFSLVTGILILCLKNPNKKTK